MSKVLAFTHDLWVTAQLKAPPFAQRTVIPRLHEAKEIIRLLTRPYLPIYQLEGQGQGGPLTVDYIGLEFTKPFLKSLIFVEDPVECQIGRIPFWRYNELEGLSSSDMTIVEAARHLIRRLPRQNAIVFPELVEHILDVQGDWQDVQGRFHGTVRRNDLRRIRKYGYDYDVSYKYQDFKEFYYQMYLPTMKNRHAELSSPKPISEVYQCFRHGCLFRVKRDGIWVSGGVCHLQQNVLILDIVGVRHGDTQLIKEGAMSARYYAAIHWANQQEYRAVSLRGSGARLESGLFQSKRKWGTAVSIPSHLHRQIWIKVRYVTPAVSQFLKANPFIVVDKDGKLHGLIMVDDPHNVPAETRKEWEKRYITPGLSSLLIRSVNNFAREFANVNKPDLVIPITV